MLSDGNVSVEKYIYGGVSAHLQDGCVGASGGLLPEMAAAGLSGWIGRWRFWFLC